MKYPGLCSLLGTLTLAASLCVLATACDRSQAADSAPPAAAPALAAAAPLAAAPPADAAPRDPNCGYYVGLFVAEETNETKHPMYQNKINVALDSIADGVVTGHSVVAGNLRPFTGTITPAGADQFKYSFELKEPGDDKYDGVFSGTLDATAHTLSGTWVANDKQLAVTKRSYELTRTDFKYDPNLQLVVIPVEVYSDKSDRDGHHRGEAVTEDAGKFNASVKALRSRDVDNLYKRDLEVMRNAIYARHGYSFQNRQMRDYFDNYVDWYVPVSVDITAELTPLELKNIELLKRYEKHAAKYYDSFGR